MVFAEIKHALGVSTLKQAALELGLAETALENLTRPNRRVPAKIIMVLRDHFPHLDTSALETTEVVARPSVQVAIGVGDLEFLKQLVEKTGKKIVITAIPHLLRGFADDEEPPS